ncbi:methyltransferase [Scenedesmus sp. PABB004]|nr:methyltransferase [Scenedesmus sp. PABB004]
MSAAAPAAAPAPYSDDVCSGAAAAAYATFRPRYPDQLYHLILSRLPEPSHRGLAVDVATGSGQAATALAPHFRRVLATDANAAQLRHATPAANVEYARGDAHDVALPDGAADAVTVASALHWLELRRFYGEVRRVLKPHGVFAAWAIPLGLAAIEVPAAPRAAPGCGAALRRIYDDLGPFWDERKRSADRMYRGLEPSADEFGSVELHELECPAELTPEQLVGYVSSWSAYAICRKTHPDRPDPLAEFRRALLDALAAEGAAPDTTLVARIPLCLILAQHPVPLPPSRAGS